MGLTKENYFYSQFSAPSDYDININSINDHLIDFNIETGIVFSLLSKINSNKAPGPDGIHGKILKNCASSIALPLSLLYNTSFKTGLIPNEWKLGNIVPVFKKGDKSSVEDYRPISLTCLVMKIFETCIRDELMSICYEKIHPSQHGFLPGKSCTTQMVPFVDQLAISLNNKSRLDVIYFDFAKAFDSVSHDIILCKLKTVFNVNGLLLKFIASYLYNRTQQVTVGGFCSNKLNVLSGVPQGSILGPLLFVLFINDMHDCIDPNTEIGLYADDTKIWRVIINDSDHIALQNDVNALYNWSFENKMTFHPNKCKVLTVSPREEVPILPYDRFPYCMGSDCLDYVNTQKDLGVYMNCKLNWTEHCNTLISKATNMLNLVKRTCHFTNSVDQKRVLYLALVRSQFEHCSVIWKPHCKTLCHKMECVQKRAVKWILGENYNSYSEMEYTKKLKYLKLLPIERKLTVNDLILFHRIIHKKICITLPDYIQLASPPRSLRTCHIDPLYFSSKIKPRQTTLTTNTTKNKSNMNDPDYGQHVLREFEHSYFYRTHLQWNKLPLHLKIIEEQEAFKNKLNSYLLGDLVESLCDSFEADESDDHG